MCIEIGEEYGCWTVLEKKGRNKTSRAQMFLCRCKCGNEMIKQAGHLTIFPEHCRKCPDFKQKKNYNKMSTSFKENLRTMIMEEWNRKPWRVIETHFQRSQK